MIRSTLAAAAIAGAFMSTAFAADTPSAPGTQVYIIAPKNGDTLSGPVRVPFSLKGMGVAPAGTETEGTGHHHLVIDKDIPPLDTYLPMNDPQVMHFGKGQTEVELKLAPGKHTLRWFSPTRTTSRMRRRWCRRRSRLR